YVVKGIMTNLRYLRAIMQHPEFTGGDYDTGFLPRAHAELLGREDPKLTEVAVLASAVWEHQRQAKRSRSLTLAPVANGGSGGGSRWRLSGRDPRRSG